MYGHTTGDKVIQVVAERLKSVLNESDFIARVGGDEFVILTRENNRLNFYVRRLLPALKHLLRLVMSNLKWLQAWV